MRKEVCFMLACALGIMVSGCGMGANIDNNDASTLESTTDTVVFTPLRAPMVRDGDSREYSEWSEYATGSSYDINDVSESDEAALEDEKSPFILWEYEGYIDECDGYYWQDEFKDCDYDGDEKADRVNRTWDQNEQTAIYKIEFGNGDILVTPMGWETGFPHIQSGDLDGDGVKEILVTLSYDTSTDPSSFGDMWLFDKDESSGEYAEVDLPLKESGENGAKGFEIDYDKPEDGKIKFTIKDASFSRTEDLGEDYISSWWSDETVSEMRSIFCAEITGSSNPVLRCYIAPFRRWSTILGFNLNYNNGQYEVGYIEIDEPDSWEQ